MAASTSAAASTSTAADSNNSACYDVFISHRGPDVKKTLASHLYRRLISYELRVFLDYKELQEGEEFPRQIKSAISAASLHVAIFSPKYADSQWCLEELVLMLESGTPIIPVFHHVKPTELRRTDGEGVYATSLRNLEKKKRKSDSQLRYDSPTIENWRNALSRVADISGLDLEAFNGDEGELVDKIVEAVLRKRVKTPLNVARYPTGLAEKVQDFETKVLFQQCRGVFGITGLGGVGKTTLALELFKRKESNYRNSYFLSDVRENAKKSLHSLQSQLLKGLFQLDLHIENRHAGIEELKKPLSSCKVLLVLDDVDHQDQVFALLPQLNDLHHDSLILITSRDKDVLRRSGVQESSIYLLSGLNTERSRELFCSHAFCKPHPLPGFESLVNKFLTACNGLPLSLKVFGGLLCGETDKSYWKDELEELRKTLPDDIQNSLQISYDALNREEQDIFLDVACFFIGEDRDTAIRVWDGSRWNGKRGFQSLVNKCLVEVSMEDNYKNQHRIIMHDHLRDMGRDLANRSGFPCRLWCGTKHMEDLLHQSSEATRVRGIRMFPREHYDERSDTDEDDERASFSRYKMKNLQILDIHEEDDDLLKCLLEGVDSPNLLYLRWRNCRWRNCRCSSLPPYIPMKKLRVLEVEGNKLETLWQEDLQAPLQLRELRISVKRRDLRYNVKSLSKIPKSIGQLKHLERMVVIIEYGDVEIPKEFYDLRSLKHLVLSVPHLSSLPDSFGNLSRLERIKLSGCSLERLPDSFGNLSTLEHIDLSKCYSFRRLPDSFGNLSRLEHIDFSECTRLRRLPDSFGNLSRLERINLSKCDTLRRLPDSFGNLSRLERINLSGCSGLERLPDSFGNLSRLERINLSCCKGLERLPDSFGNLSRLEHIDFSECHGLRRLPDSFGNLSRQERINLSHCISLGRLPDSFGNLSRLEHIKLSSCRRLERLPDSFGNLSRLEGIDLSGCFPALKKLPDCFGTLSMLKDIDLRYGAFKSLPDSFGNLSMLESINLSSCCRLKRLPDSFGNLSMLESINLSSCCRLKRLPDSFGNLSRLQYIDLSYCHVFGRLPDSFGNLIKLEYLDLTNCHRLIIPVGTFRKITLEYMHLPPWNIQLFAPQIAPQWSPEELLFYLMNLTEWPSATGEAGHLEKLVLEAPFLEALPPSFGRDLRNLKFLELRKCRGLKRLPDSFRLLNQLIHLRVINCSPELPPSFGRGLRNLNFLELESCRSLKRLPDSFRLLNQLNHLRVEYCSPELPPSFGRGLRNLNFLELKRCRSLKRSPDSFRLLNQLIHLRVDCHSLELLPPSVGPNLRNLKLLELVSWSVKYLPDSILLLNQLIHLRVHCGLLELLPPSFGRGLRNLKFLELQGCYKLNRLPDSFLLLNQLVDLTVVDCSPELHFKAVEGENETLTVSGGERTSSNLERCLLRLQYLRLHNTKISEVLFPTCVFPNLQCLHISDCHDLVEVTLPNALRSLTLHNCSKLRKIGAPLPTGACPNLQDLHIMKCKDLVSEVSSGNESFHNASFEDLPCVMTSRHGLVIKVEIFNFSKLRKIGGSFPTDVCPKFWNINIQRCKNLVELEILPTALQHLNIRECRQLVEVDCPNLQPLEIWPVDPQELGKVERLRNGNIKLQLIDCPKLNRTAMWFYNAKKRRKKPRVFS